MRRLRPDNIQIMQSRLAIAAIKIDLQIPLLVLKLCEAGISIYSVGLQMASNCNDSKYGKNGHVSD